jgi:hypothetical protein
MTRARLGGLGADREGQPDARRAEGSGILSENERRGLRRCVDSGMNTELSLGGPPVPSERNHLPGVLRS